MAPTIIPNAPSFLPPAKQAEWKKKYEEAFKQAQKDEPEDVSAQHRAAQREANRMLRVPEITSAEQAQGMDAHLFIKREEKDGVLKVVTIDGNKYSFKVAKAAAKPTPAQTPPAV
jgi:hypothetical protein